MGTGLLRTGAVMSVAGMVTPLVAGWPEWALVVSVSLATALAIVVFCTISGTVTTLVPLAVGLALAAGKGPGTLAMVAALSASFAFLLPANSAPNALAYGTGYFRSLEMLRAGIMLIVLSIVVVVLIADLLWPVLGFRI